MKVILKENIDTLGNIGDIVKVAPGYARNYLLPKGFAVEATEKNARELEHIKRQMAYKKDKVAEVARLALSKLEEIVVEIERVAGAEGKLFGSVTNMDIALALKEKGVEVERRKILLAEPIKQVGEYDVSVKLHPEVTATLKVNVVAAVS